MLITYLASGFLSPFLGGIIDRVGQRAWLNLVAAALVVVVHGLLGLTSMNPIGPLVLLGLCYSIYASALWPSIAIVVPAERAATAYGIITAVQNLGLALVPTLVGALQNQCPKTYTCVEMAFVGLGVLGVVAGIALNIADRAAPLPLLNLSDSQLEARRRADKAATAKAAAGDGPAALGGAMAPFLETPITPAPGAERDRMRRALAAADDDQAKPAAGRPRTFSDGGR